jgi:microcystin degradation protein MlrC
MLARRILVARLFHESHGFNPVTTGAERFEVQRGAALAQALATAGTTLGGLARKLQSLGHEVVPLLSAAAPPSGPVDHAFYVALRDELLERARRDDFDAIALELHGAMCTTALKDAEGDLLARLRDVVGPEKWIAIGLDLHAHVTPTMLGAVDICIACKENPHSDVVECGTRVATCLDAALAGRLRPVTTLVKVPMLLPGGQETGSGPLAELHARARALAAQHTEFHDISLFNVFRSIDDAGIGQAVTVLSHGPSEAATSAAQELGSQFWARRAEFRDDLLSIDDALDFAARHREKRPFVLADMGDRVLAGAPGDSTAILQVAFRHLPPLRGVLPVTDPDSAAAAIAMGVGASFTRAIGGRMTPGFTPFEISGTVTHVSRGNFTIAGVYQQGEAASHGAAAVVLVDGRLSVLLTSAASFTHDPAAFTSQGIDLAAQDFVVAKSGYHFKLNFAGIATPLSVATPGIGYYTPGLLPWRSARFWPEHDIAAPDFCPTIFDRRHPS